MYVCVCVSMCVCVCVRACVEIAPGKRGGVYLRARERLRRGTLPAVPGRDKEPLLL